MQHYCRLFVEKNERKERERERGVIVWSIREGNPRALQTHHHTCTSMRLYFVHCEVFGVTVKHWNISKCCNNVSMGIFIYILFFSERRRKYKSYFVKQNPGFYQNTTDFIFILMLNGYII